jgi:hypothetical protein
MDWHQLWVIISLPDNIPIIGLMFLIPFFTWYGLKQAFENDRLVETLEKDPELAKTHHRKAQPYKKGWVKEVHVWPYLLRNELLAAIIITAILMVWSITLDAPLEEPANPTLTMNPAKAPWYFLGLQEMLVYFDPWIAGVVMPTLIIVGLIAIPYIDENPLGNGYYTYKQRKFAIWTFIVGFIVLWCVMIVIGTLIRGPGWMWFWPGQTWDHNKLIFEVNRDLHEIFGITGQWPIAIFGGVVTAAFVAVTAFAVHKIMVLNAFSRKILDRMTLLQYLTMQILMITMLSLPAKIVARLLFRIKYIWVTPWFNV